MTKIITGPEIRKMRSDMGLSQAEFAEQIGLDAGGVSRVERGLEINARTAIKLSKFFGLPIDRFYQDDTVGVAS